VVVRVQQPRQGQLPGVVQAGDALRAGFCLREHRQKDGRQNRDQRNHHQQLDQCKGAPPTVSWRLAVLPNWTYRIHLRSVHRSALWVRLNKYLPDFSALSKSVSDP
jgi:hypothetical protein